jgi:integrase
MSLASAKTNRCRGLLHWRGRLHRKISRDRLELAALSEKAGTRMGSKTLVVDRHLGSEQKFGCGRRAGAARDREPDAHLSEGGAQSAFLEHVDRSLESGPHILQGGRKGLGTFARPLAEASRIALVDPATTFHVLRHTYGSSLATKGVPMGVIAAQLGHSDTRMTEKHYAHLSPNYVADKIRAALPALGNVQKTNDTALAGP